MTSFGQRLRALRKEKKLTQKQAAQVFSISESGVSMFENNEREPSLEMIDKMASYFEVSADYLMGRSIARSPGGGHAYADGGAGWTQEEKDAAAAYIEMLRQQKKARAEREQGN